MKTLKPYLLSFLFLCSLGGYLAIGYGIERTNSDLLISCFLILFLCYFLSLKWIDSQQKVKWGIAAAILFRIALLFSVPTLSDDFYRFIWDGSLLAHGINPFAHMPVFYMQNGLPDFLSAEVFRGLNSAHYYTIYPAVCQYIFGIAAGLSGGAWTADVTAMKIIMLLFEVGSFWVIKKLLTHFHLPLKYLLIYALNPLIILELTGNLHFEGVMIFFLLSAFYLFLKQRFWMAALCFLLAVNTKLIPLLLLPYLVFSYGGKRSIQLIAILLFGTLLLHLPFLGGDFLNHFSNSLAYFFQSFEFNASLYYLVRWAGYQLVGYNIIHMAAPILACIATGIIVVVSWKFRDQSFKNLPVIFISILTIYYFFSTIIHPWYITILIAFTPFTTLFFPLAWSALIPLTYITYTTADYNENLWLVGIEYIVVILVIFYDHYSREKFIRAKSHGTYL